MKAFRLHMVLVLILAAACSTSTPAPSEVETSTGEVRAFHIPPTMNGNVVDGKITYDLVMQSGTTEFMSGKETATLGYNGDYLGPTLVMNKGDEVVINVTNNLGGSSSSTYFPHSTTHWHGFHVPGKYDGGPHQEILAGETWSPTFTILNRPGTYWYHPHLHPVADKMRDPDGTSGQIFRGLAGLIIVRDEETEQLSLPSRYGVDDIPLILQDRSFNEDGSFLHFPTLDFPFNTRGPLGGPLEFPLRKGDKFLVNGIISPVLETHAQMVRFRILNASNNRIYNLGFSDNRTYSQIGSDGGLLEAPVPLQRLVITPGERVEIVADFGKDENSSVRLRSFASELGKTNVHEIIADDYDRIDFDIFTIDVGAPTSNPVTALPESLTRIDRIPAEEAVNRDNPRRFFLSDRPLDLVFLINDKEMDMGRIDAVVQLGDTEIWEFTNRSPQAHPMHVHGDSFQVLSRNGSLDNVAANERGWKDVVNVKPGETVQIIKRFEDFYDADYPYMFHCHLLDHSDAGMMGQFIVVEPGGTESSPEPIPPVSVEAQPMKVTSDIVGFELEDLVIPVGTEVTWTNQDLVRHDTASGAPSEPARVWSSSPLDKGESFSHLFLEPGTFPYFCTIHPSMTATVTVKEP